MCVLEHVLRKIVGVGHCGSSSIDFMDGASPSNYVFNSLPSPNLSLKNDINYV